MLLVVQENKHLSFRAGFLWWVWSFLWAALKSALHLEGSVWQEYTCTARLWSSCLWARRSGGKPQEAPFTLASVRIKALERLLINLGGTSWFHWDQLNWRSHPECNINFFFLWNKFKLTEKMQKIKIVQRHIYPLPRFTFVGIFTMFAYHLCSFSLSYLHKYTHVHKKLFFLNPMRMLHTSWLLTLKYFNMYFLKIGIFSCF